MTWQLVNTSIFNRALRRYRKRHPEADASLRATLAQLRDDPFHPRLRTHKLKGELAGAWSCSAGYDLRIIFDIDEGGSQTITLLTVGSHDDAY